MDEPSLTSLPDGDPGGRRRFLRTAVAFAAVAIAMVGFGLVQRLTTPPDWNRIGREVAGLPTDAKVVRVIEDQPPGPIVEFTLPTRKPPEKWLDEIERQNAYTPSIATKRSKTPFRRRGRGWRGAFELTYDPKSTRYRYVLSPDP